MLRGRRYLATERRPELTAVLRGLLRAAAVCDDPAQGAPVAALLAGDGGATGLVFGRNDAWRSRASDGLWFAGQMRRWG